MKEQMIEILEKNKFGILTAVLYIVFTNMVFGYICPSMWLLGLPCPACGLSRAAVSLVLLDFPGAFQYNPMIFALIPAIYFYYKRLLLPFTAVVLLMFIVFFVRISTSFGVEPLIINREALIFIFLGGVTQ